MLFSKITRRSFQPCERGGFHHFVINGGESLPIGHKGAVLTAFIGRNRLETLVTGNIFEGFARSNACLKSIFFLNLISFGFSAIFLIVFRLVHRLKITVFNLVYGPVKLILMLKQS